MVFWMIFVLLFQDFITKVTEIEYFNYIDELFILFLFIFLIFKRKIKISYDTVKLFIMTSIFWSIGIIYCIIFSNYSLFSLLMSSFLAIKFFLTVIAVTVLRPDDKLIFDIIVSLKVIGLFSFITGIFNLIFPNVWVTLIPYTWISWRMGFPSVMGLFIHPGQFGWFMLFVATLYYSEYKTTKEKNKLIVFIAYSLIAVMSMRMNVIVGVGCIILAEWFIVEKKKVTVKKLVGPILGSSLLLLSMGDYIYYNISKYILGTFSEISARYMLLRQSIQILMDYFPFGVGFGKFGSWYARINYSEYYYLYNCNNIYGLRPDDPRYATDTFWPAIFGETGILGTIIYISFLVFIAHKQLKTVQNDKMNKFHRWIALFGFLALIQSVIESLAEPAFNSAPQNIFLGFIVGLGLCMGSRNRTEKCKSI